MNYICYELHFGTNRLGQNVTVQLLWDKLSYNHVEQSLTINQFLVNTIHLKITLSEYNKTKENSILTK